jgi:hypothetical protein
MLKNHKQTKQKRKRKRGALSTTKDSLILS